jgi:hypothetical protein
MKRYLSIIVTIFVIVMYHYALNRTKNQLKSVQSELTIVKHENDSIRSEITIKDIEIGRYEYIFDRAQTEMSPDCQKELEDIWKQTE